MTTFQEVRQFLLDLEKKHESCPSLCGRHIQKTRQAIDGLEILDMFVDRLDQNPRLLQILRETVKIADNLHLLSVFARFSILFDKILKRAGI